MAEFTDNDPLLHLDNESGRLYLMYIEELVQDNGELSPVGQWVDQFLNNGVSEENVFVIDLNLQKMVTDLLEAHGHEDESGNLEVSEKYRQGLEKVKQQLANTLLLFDRVVYRA